MTLWSLSHWNSPFGFHGAIQVFLLKPWLHLLGILPLPFLEYWYSLEFFSNPSIYYFFKMVSPTLLLQITATLATHVFTPWPRSHLSFILISIPLLDITTWMTQRYPILQRSQRHHFTTSSPNPLPLIAPSAYRGLNKIGLSLNADETLDSFLKLCASLLINKTEINSYLIKLYRNKEEKNIWST